MWHFTQENCHLYPNNIVIMSTIVSFTWFDMLSKWHYFWIFYTLRLIFGRFEHCSWQRIPMNKKKKKKKAKCFRCRTSSNEIHSIIRTTYLHGLLDIKLLGLCIEWNVRASFAIVFQSIFICDKGTYQHIRT